VDAVTKITQAMNLNSADDCIRSISVSVQLIHITLYIQSIYTTQTKSHDTSINEQANN